MAVLSADGIHGRGYSDDPPVGKTLLGWRGGTVGGRADRNVLALHWDRPDGIRVRQLQVLGAPSTDQLRGIGAFTVKWVDACTVHGGLASLVVVFVMNGTGVDFAIRRSLTVE